jgi:putative flippase GtrA
MSYFTAAVERMERLGLPIPRGLHKFLGVGLVGLIVHEGLFSLFYYVFHVQKSVAWLCALAVATSITWTLNRRHTFAASGRKLHQEAFRYAIVTIVSQSVSFGVFHGMDFAGLPSWLNLLIGAAAATVVSYVGQRFFTFAPHKDQAETPPK